MTMRSVRMALGGLVLTCGGCVVAPPPAPVAVAQNCRQFTQTITVDGKSQPGYGVQCLQPDGTWQVVVPPTTTPPPVVAAPGQAYVYQPPYYAYPYAYPYAYDYAYPYAYPWAYPWYFGPGIAIGVGPGFGWYGGWRGGGWYGRR